MRGAVGAWPGAFTAAGLLAVVGCASTQTSVSRGRPSGRAVHAAFDALSGQASRCLGARDRVTVEGFFDGRTGEFFVERVGTASPETRVSVQQCVAGVMERSRVRPFGGARFDAAWTVAVSEVSDAVRAMMDGGAEVPSGEVVGEVDAEGVLAVLRRERPEAQRCYEDALRGAPTLRGAVELRFTLSVDGRITHAVASGPRGFRGVGHCILGRLRARSWPAAQRASVDFVVPMSFAPRNASPDASSEGQRP